MHVFDTLVLSGGGPDGIAFVGCIAHLERSGGIRRLRTVVGCSAGAIVALFVALGMTSEDMRAWMKRGVHDGSLVDVDIEGVLTIVDRLGVDDGERVVEALRGALRACPRLGGASDATFVELAKATGRNLVVCVSNLEDARQELLGVDTAPDMSVVTAVRMSFSVPLLFTPVRHRGRTYVDGAVFDYCPTTHIATSGDATSTLVLRIEPVHAHARPRGGDDAKEEEGEDVTAPGIVDYMGMLARAMMMRTMSCGLPTSSHGPSPTQLTTVDVPSLGGGDAPPCSFSLRSLSLCIDDDGIDRYVLHGEHVTALALQQQQ